MFRMKYAHLIFFEINPGCQQDSVHLTFALDTYLWALDYGHAMALCFTPESFHVDAADVADEQWLLMEEDV
eukprot:5067466-Amphidinium_carterae.1